MKSYETKTYCKTLKIKQLLRGNIVWQRLGSCAIQHQRWHFQAGENAHPKLEQLLWLNKASYRLLVWTEVFSNMSGIGWYLAICMLIRPLCYCLALDLLAQFDEWRLYTCWEWTENELRPCPESIYEILKTINLNKPFSFITITPQIIYTCAEFKGESNGTSIEWFGWYFFNGFLLSKF